MIKQYFSFSEETRKIKSKFLVLSGASLFVGLTEALPKKFSLVGLDLSNNQEVLGWFIFFISVVLLLNFVIVAVLELIEHYLPSLIKKETDKTTGDTLGLTPEECLQSQVNNNQQNEAIGTPTQELKDINRKNTIITHNYKSAYIKLHNIMVLAFEFFSPIIFSIFGIYFLYRYLSCIN
jgi:hypothetical protein